jgi:ribose 5-phosphate isomerase A
MDFKEQAAKRALDYIHSGMCLGLGTGSTTALFINMLGVRLQAGLLRDIRAVATSDATARRARELGIPLTTLSEAPSLDLAVDGADEVDPHLDLIKGLGKALLREKIVEVQAHQLMIIVDESKMVTRLGTGPLPVEIVPFEAEFSVRWLTRLGCRAELWLDETGAPFVTDNGNYLARCWFFTDPQDEIAGISNPYALARALADQPGVVEHGLFLNLASRVVVAGQEGVRILEREK